MLDWMAKTYSFCYAEFVAENFYLYHEAITLMYYAARQQHIEWLKEQLAEEETKLAEAEARVIELRGSIAYYKQAIEQLLPTASDSSSPNSSQEGDTSSYEDSNSRQVRKNLLPEGNVKLFEDEDFEEEDYLELEADDKNKRSPKDMLQPHLKGKTLGDIAAIYLKAAKGKGLSSDDIAQQIFEATSEEEFQRAKNSLSTELRRGAREGRWKKNARGMFSANPDSF